MERKNSFPCKEGMSQACFTIDLTLLLIGVVCWFIPLDRGIFTVSIVAAFFGGIFAQKYRHRRRLQEENEEM